MRNNLIILFLLTLIFSCNPENLEEEEQGPRDLRSLTFSLASNYFDNPEVHSGHLYLSNENGDVVDQVELISNSTPELIMDYDSNSAFDLTMADRYKFERSSGDFISYRLKTFRSIEPYHFEFKEPQISSFEEGARAFLNIANTGGPLRDIISQNSYYQSSSETMANFEIYLYHQNEDIYVSFFPQGRDKRRYILLEDIDNGFSADYNMDSLPIAEDQVVINYPSTDKLSVEIWGATQSDPDNFFAYLSNDLNSITPPYSIHYIPTDEFVQFRQFTRCEIENKVYDVIEIDNTIHTEFSIPDLDFEITNTVNETYEFLPKTNFDYYSIRMYYLNEAENYQIIWDIYGKSSNESIKIRYPKILDLLGPESMPESVNDFDIYSTEIRNVEGLDSYLEYCNIMLDPNSPVDRNSNKIETMKIQ